MKKDKLPLEEVMDIIQSITGQPTQNQNAVPKQDNVVDKVAGMDTNNERDHQCAQIFSIVSATKAVETGDLP